MLIVRNLNPANVDTAREFRLQVRHFPPPLRNFGLNNFPAKVKERLYRFNYVSAQKIMHQPVITHASFPN